MASGKKRQFYAFALIILAGILFVSFSSVPSFKSYLAQVIFPEKITVEELRYKYNNSNIKVLIVPGHDNDSGSGTQFRDIKEADLNLSIAKNIQKIFNTDQHFETYITRDDLGYKPEFASYFKEKYGEIVTFRNRLRSYMQNLLSSGLVKKNVIVEHNNASENDSIKLYGINKWANDNEIDIVIHIHFNDYPGRKYSHSGKYSGFSIYFPEGQLPNYHLSSAIAKNVFDQLNKYFSPSDNPIEQGGLVEDQELIAIGSNASLNGGAMLIEVGYIYESQFVSQNTKDATMQEIAYQTYYGIKKFFDSGIVTAQDSSLLPYFWDKDLKYGLKNDRDVLSLQAALVLEGVYPRPITGNFLNLTREAVKEFQRKHNFDVVPDTGYVGPYTRKVLNGLYSKKL